MDSNFKLVNTSLRTVVKQSLFFILLICILFTTSCAKKMERKNPFDPGGSNPPGTIAGTAQIQSTSVSRLSSALIPTYKATDHSGISISVSGAQLSATTDSSGAYSISNVTAGTYTVTASKTGYTSQSQSNVVVTAGQTTQVPTLSLTLTLSDLGYKLTKTISNAYIGTGRVACNDAYIFVSDRNGKTLRKFDYNGVVMGTVSFSSGCSGVSIYSGYLYVIVSDKIKKYDLNLNFQSEISITSIDGPLCIDNNGNYFVGSYWSYSIVKYSSAGSTLLSFGSQGMGSGQFSNPAGIALDSSGKIYVADAGLNNLDNKRYQVFDSSGNYLSSKSFASAGFEGFASVNDVAIGSDGTLYVRLVNTDTSFYVIKADGTEGKGCTEGYPDTGWSYGISVSPSGKIVVLNDSSHSIKIYSK